MPETRSTNAMSREQAAAAILNEIKVIAANGYPFSAGRIGGALLVLTAPPTIEPAGPTATPTRDPLDPIRTESRAETEDTLPATPGQLAAALNLIEKARLDCNLIWDQAMRDVRGLLRYESPMSSAETPRR